MIIATSFPVPWPRWLSSEQLFVLGLPTRTARPPSLPCDPWGRGSGVWGPAALPCWQPAHPPAVDAHGDPVIGLVAANVPDELQDGLDGRGDVVVRPVLVVEVVDGAGCLQDKSRISAGFLLDQKSCPITSSHLHQQQRAEQQFAAGFAAGAVL